ncbi:MAG: hypothetical protein WC755_00070 [Candidatus Woesearchaeota archaeon]|jgi:hypothetical protein
MSYQSEVRTRIIRLLAKHDNLKAKQMYRMLNLPVTYQAVFKMIKTMVDEKTLDQNKLSYSLNDDFVKDTVSFVEELKVNEKEKYSSVLSKVSDGKEKVVLNFKRQIDLLEFLLGFVEYQTSAAPNDYCLFHVNCLFGIFSFSPKLTEKLQNILSKSRVYIIVKQDTRWNDAIIQLWKRLTVNIKSGVNFGGKDVLVYKNIVCKVIYDETNAQELCEVARKVQQLSNINIMEMIYNLYENNINISLEISSDPKFASTLKDRFMGEF